MQGWPTPFRRFERSDPETELFQTPYQLDSYRNAPKASLGLKPGSGVYFREFNKLISSTYIKVDLVGFTMLAALNLATSLLDANSLVSTFGNYFWGGVVANFVYDSVGTLAGLLGSVLLFAPVLLGAPYIKRKSISIYFLLGSVSVGIASSLIWNRFFANGGTISYGSSAIDIAAQSIIFTMAIWALVRSFVKKPEGSQTDSYILNSFRVIYLTLILTTLWFILQLEPIFVATDQFNWRVHEIAFLSGMAVTAFFLLSTGVRLEDKVTKQSAALSLAPDDSSI